MKKDVPGEVAAIHSGQTGTPDSQPLTSPTPPHIPDHEMLRCIGQGSYGEVWLARNIMGEHRAAKVVRRAIFGDNRPFEREFEGIKKFEPISRSHESQVQILHVGLNAVEGYFYYVMEPADDAKAGVGCQIPDAGSQSGGVRRETPVSGIQHPAYSPRTLRHDLQARGRLPVNECVEIGLALTTALAHLHKQGLVHRDIKPSNIIFVNGRPKLADIGLVTDVGDAQSIVGTEGYLPPEGPGAPTADIYALGMVLYEISTGRDRRHFPNLPLDLSPGSARGSRAESGGSPDCCADKSSATHTLEPAANSPPPDPSQEGNSPPCAAPHLGGAGGGFMGSIHGKPTAPRALPDAFEDWRGLLELNEILLKACARDARERYQSAEEMHADLELLQRGQSVKRRRVRERRWIIGKRLLIAGAALAFVAAGLGVIVRQLRRPVAMATSSRLQSGRTIFRPSTNTEANMLVKQGFEFLKSDRFEKALTCFTNASRLDPNFPQACVGEFEVYVFDRSVEQMGRLRSTARKLLELDDHLAAAHSCQSYVQFSSWEFDAALRSVRRAIELDPDHAEAHLFLGFYLTYLGWPEEGRLEYARGVELDPANPRYLRHLGHPDYALRNFDKALAQYRKALELEDRHTLTRYWIGACHRAKGEVLKAIDEFEAYDLARGSAADSKSRYNQLRSAYRKAGEHGYWLKQRELAEADPSINPYELAKVLSHLGPTAEEEMFVKLEAAYDRRQRDTLEYLRFDECWDRFRTNARFNALLRKVGFPELNPP